MTRQEVGHWVDSNVYIVIDSNATSRVDYQVGGRESWSRHYPLYRTYRLMDQLSNAAYAAFAGEAST